MELQKLMNLFFYAALVAGRRTGELDLWFHGEIFWLQSSEFINGGELAPLLFLAEGATPCCGAYSTREIGRAHV